MVKLADIIQRGGDDRGPVDPIELFNQLDLRGGDVQEMWRPQGDALRDWHDARDENDILFQLNTGAGKTLIGLVAAQSLVNETERRVLYVCATNQLLEQTAEKADEYGVTVATYYQGEWSNEAAYTRCEGPGLTNYAAVFNGRSIFEREDLVPRAVVFDDAHTAHGIVRDQFTLRISRSRYPAVYDRIVGQVREHFEDAGRTALLRDVVERHDPYSVLFVPLWVSASNAEWFSQVFRDAGLTETGDPSFVWPHLREQLPHCAMLFDHRRIEFTPLVPPVHTLRVFQDDVRRLYLSATLEMGEDFCRTFGRYPDEVIAPGGRAGDTERMMLPAPRGLSEEGALEWARDAVGERKALIMVPSSRAAEDWDSVADVFETEAGHDRIQEFADSDDQKLVLRARYDGIDLPGEACRILIVDGLPVGTSLLERFFEQHLEIRGISREIIASRIVQLLGRISRGMTDHGAFLLVGERLLRWLDDPSNRDQLPEHIRKQLQLGDTLAEHYEELSAADFIERCLQRDEEWLEAYDEHMKDEGEQEPTAGRERPYELSLAEAEVEYVRRIWSGQPDRAARALNRAEDVAFERDETLGAWYLHWIGHALSYLDEDEAEECYRDAGRLQRELGRLPVQIEAREEEAGSQAERMHDYLTSRGLGAVRDMESAASALRSEGASPAEKEEAVARVGEALGLTSSRPDEESGTGHGPDVFWNAPDRNVAFVIELKTNKQEDTPYRKEEVGQLHQHLQWLAEEHPEAAPECLLVGPRRRCSPGASPPPGVRIVSPADVAELAEDLAELFRRARDEELSLFVPAVIQGAVGDLDLAWEGLLDRFETVELGGGSSR